jgi:hypothetical protein
MSWTTSSRGHGSVVTVSRVIDDDAVGVIDQPSGELFSESNDSTRWRR